MSGMAVLIANDSGATLLIDFEFEIFFPSSGFEGGGELIMRKGE